jgi:uncharacterized protein (TIGR00304 family)
MADVASMGVLLIFIGLAAIFAGILLSSRKGDRHAKGAGVVMVGPIPIIFGSDARWTSVAIVLAIILVAISLILYVV